MPSLSCVCFWPDKEGSTRRQKPKRSKSTSFHFTATCSQQRHPSSGRFPVWMWTKQPWFLRCATALPRGVCCRACCDHARSIFSVDSPPLPLFPASASFSVRPSCWPTRSWTPAPPQILSSATISSEFYFGLSFYLFVYPVHISIDLVSIHLGPFAHERGHDRRLLPPR